MPARTLEQTTDSLIAEANVPEKGSKGLLEGSIRLVEAGARQVDDAQALKSDLTSG
jgi:hypothetical protein